MSTRTALRSSLRLLFITASYTLLSRFILSLPHLTFLSIFSLYHHEASDTMSSLISSVLSYAGALLPVVLLAGLLWATATALDSDASHPKHKQRVPGSWDSVEDEHLLFFSPSSPRPRPSSVTRTLSSALSSLFPFFQPRSISSNSLITSCPSALSSPHLSHLSHLHSRTCKKSSRTHKKRPSARASSTGVFSTSTLPKTYSHLTNSQYRPFLSDDPVSKAWRQGLLTYEAVDNVLYGKWSLPYAIGHSAEARKNFSPAAASEG